MERMSRTAGIWYMVTPLCECSRCVWFRWKRRNSCHSDRSARLLPTICHSDRSAQRGPERSERGRNVRLLFRCEESNCRSLHFGFAESANPPVEMTDFLKLANPVIFDRSAQRVVEEPAVGLCSGSRNGCLCVQFPSTPWTILDGNDRHGTDHRLCRNQPRDHQRD
jgi:hypothetical protein